MLDLHPSRTPGGGGKGTAHLNEPSDEEQVCLGIVDATRYLLLFTTSEYLLYVSLHAWKVMETQIVTTFQNEIKSQNELKQNLRLCKFCAAISTLEGAF